MLLNTTDVVVITTRSQIYIHIDMKHMNSTSTIPTSTIACSVSTFASTLDKVLDDIQLTASENGYSEVLMLTLLRQWCNDRLSCAIG